LATSTTVPSNILNNACCTPSPPTSFPPPPPFTPLFLNLSISSIHTIPLCARSTSQPAATSNR
ncbi:hypothetical protein, partial [Sporisorium scitamineum]